MIFIIGGQFRELPIFVQGIVIMQWNIAIALLQYYCKKQYLNTFKNAKNIALLQYFFSNS